MTHRVGVRELRQNLSVYLDRVKTGEVLEVTEHGRVVARLAPATHDDDALARLRAAGRIRDARGPLAALGPPEPSAGPPLSEVLRALREEDAR